MPGGVVSVKTHHQGDEPLTQTGGQPVNVYRTKQESNEMVPGVPRERSSLSVRAGGALMHKTRGWKRVDALQNNPGGVLGAVPRGVDPTRVEQAESTQTSGTV